MRAETGRAPDQEGQGRREDHQGSGIGSIVTATYDILPAGEAASPTVDPYQLLPDLTPEEYQALRDDIEANGLRVPVDVDEDGNVLDGHHRQRVATELGIDCETRVIGGLTEQGKRDHALAVNTARRQLSRDQRRQVIANSLNADPELSDREHARRVGCDHKTVADVRAVMVMSGELPQSDTRIGGDGRATTPPAAEDRPLPPEAWACTDGGPIGSLALLDAWEEADRHPEDRDYDNARDIIGQAAELVSELDDLREMLRESFSDRRVAALFNPTRLSR